MYLLSDFVSRLTALGLTVSAIGGVARAAIDAANVSYAAILDSDIVGGTNVTGAGRKIVFSNTDMDLEANGLCFNCTTNNGTIDLDSNCLSVE